MVKRFYPEHLRRRRQRLSVVGVVFALLIIFGLGLWFYKKGSSKVSWRDYVNNDLGVKLSYPETFIKGKISADDERAKIVFRIIKSDSSAMFSLRYENKLGMSRVSGGKDVLANMVSSVNRYYPDRFPDYRKESYEETALAKGKAARFDFTYTGTDGKTKMKQRFVLVVRENTAYYLSCQAPDKDFFKSERYFDRIINSFEFLD